jgi:acyl carrier protein
VVEELRLHVPAEEIGDDQALRGPASLGLDSIDIVILAVAIEKTYHLRIAGPEAAQQMFQSVTTMAAAIAEHQDGLPGGS